MLTLTWCDFLHGQAYLQNDNLIYDACLIFSLPAKNHEEVNQLKTWAQKLSFVEINIYFAGPGDFLVFLAAPVAFEAFFVGGFRGTLAFSGTSSATG